MIWILGLLFCIIWLVLIVKAKNKIRNTADIDFVDKELNNKLRGALDEISNEFISLQNTIEDLKGLNKKLKYRNSELEKSKKELEEKIQSLSREMEQMRHTINEERTQERNWIDEFNKLLTSTNDQEIIKFWHDHFDVTKNIDLDLSNNSLFETRVAEFPLQIVKLKGDNSYNLIPYIPFVRNKDLFESDFSKFEVVFEVRKNKGQDFGFLKLESATKVKYSNSGEWLIMQKGVIYYTDSNAEQARSHMNQSIWEKEVVSSQDAKNQTGSINKKVSREEEVRDKKIESTIEDRMIEQFNESLNSDVTHMILFGNDKAKANLAALGSRTILAEGLISGDSYDYLVFDDYLLFPAFESLQNNNIKRLEACFEIEEVISETTKPSWTLVKCGRVEPINNNRKQWLLREKGILKVVIGNR